MKKCCNIYQNYTSFFLCCFLNLTFKIWSLNCSLMTSILLCSSELKGVTFCTASLRQIKWQASAKSENRLWSRLGEASYLVTFPSHFGRRWCWAKLKFLWLDASSWWGQSRMPDINFTSFEEKRGGRKKILRLFFTMLWVFLVVLHNY